MDWMREQDYFGHTVTLNFDRNGDTHKTIIGGFFSIFIKAFIIWYVYLNFYQLLTYGNDNMQYTESLVDLEQRQMVKYHEMDI